MVGSFLQTSLLTYATSTIRIEIFDIKENGEIGNIMKKHNPYEMCFVVRIH